MKPARTSGHGLAVVFLFCVFLFCFGGWLSNGLAFGWGVLVCLSLFAVFAAARAALR